MMVLLVSALKSSVSCHYRCVILVCTCVCVCGGKGSNGKPALSAAHKSQAGFYNGRCRAVKLVSGAGCSFVRVWSRSRLLEETRGFPCDRSLNNANTQSFILYFDYGCKIVLDIR